MGHYEISVKKPASESWTINFRKFNHQNGVFRFAQYALKLPAGYRREGTKLRGKIGTLFFILNPDKGSQIFRKKDNFMLVEEDS